MEKLLEAITDMASLVSPEKIQTLAVAIRKIERARPNANLADFVGTSTASAGIEKVVDAWRDTNLTSGELASMLLSASHAITNISKRESAELVWTGPTTPYVSARRTEQALLQVIGAAKHTLFFTSFVAYDVSTVVGALNSAGTRGVKISMLLESARQHGGSISMDVIGRMRTMVPAAQLYAWRERSPEFADGRVHAKVVVADGATCFITSANLTGHAMEQNMEAGVLHIGGVIPKLLQEHLNALVYMKTITAV